MKTLFRRAFRIITAVMVIMTVVLFFGYSVIETQAQEYRETITDTPKYASSYTLSYNANGGSGAPSSQSGSTSCTVSSTVPSRMGYTFLGWSTSSSSSTVYYVPGDSISLSYNRTLYAVWQSATTMSLNSSYTAYVNFANQERFYSFTPSSSGTYIFESTGSFDSKVYVYNSSGSQLGYNDDGGNNTNFRLSLSLTSGTKYYVKVRAYSSSTGSTSFSVKPTSYTLTYNNNGGSGSPSSQTGASGYTISSTIPTRMGYTFLGWSKSSGASSASYIPGNSISLSSDTTLYAVWKSATTMSSNTSYTPSISFVGQEIFYSFTPSASTTYTFESSASFDTMIYVYSSSGSQISSNDDGGSNRNFKLSVSLTSGTKYYVKVKAYSSGTGSLPFTVSGNVSYTLTYNANGGSGAPSSQTGSSSYTVSSTTPVKFGYTFLGWSKSSTATSASYTSGNTITLTSNTTLYAVWRSNVTALSVNSSVSASVTSSNKVVYYEFTPSSTGYYVIYSAASSDTKVALYNSSGTLLSSDDDSGGNYNFYLRYSLTSGNRYVYAVQYYNSSATGTIPFVFGRSYTVSYNANGGLGAPSSQIRDYGKTITLSSAVPTKNGSTFRGWAKSSSSTTIAYQPSASFSENADVTLYAVWSQGYTLTYNANGGSGAPSSQSGYSSYTISSTVPVKFGYTFLGWSKSSTATSASYTSGNTISLTANTTLYAVWRSNVTVLSVNTSANASVTSSKRVVYYEFTPSTSAKYVIYSSGSVDVVVSLYDSNGNQLARDDDSGGNYNFLLRYDMTAGNRYVYAVQYYNSSNTGTISFKFGRAYTVSYNANGGLGAPSSQIRDYGKTITLSSAVPTKNGSTFRGWAKSSSSTTIAYQPSASFSENADVTLYAVWSQGYTLTYNANGGSGAPSSQSGYSSYTISSTVPVKFGYTFLGWSKSSTATSATYSSGDTITLTADTTLYAVWEANTYTIRYNVNGGIGTMADSYHTYDVSGALTSCTFTKTGYTFLGWSISSSQTDVTYSDGESVRNLTATDNATVTLYAVWDANTYTVRYNANGGSGSMADSDFTCYEPGALSLNTFTRADCTFLGWAERSDATVAVYSDGTVVENLTTENNGVFELYAVWHMHSYITTITEEPTCTQTGTKTITCEGCDYSSSGSIPATGHDWTGPTCTTKDTCATCGETQGEIPGHRYTSEVTTEPTCTDPGTRTFTCSVCSDLYRETIPPAGHSWINATCTTKQTCSSCGITTGDALGHSYNSKVTREPTCSQTGMKAFVCSKCLDTYTEVIPATGHDWADASCTLPMTCTVCDATQGNALGHAYVSEKIIEETCTTDGTTEYTCSRCTDSYTEAIPATGHSWTDATCTLPQTCVSCDETSGEALGHSYESEITVEAACLTDGTESYECSRCHDSYTEAIPATGHTWTDATCTLPQTCSVCSATTGEALGHNYIGEVTIAVTCLTDGTETFECSDCHDSYTETIPATGHNWLSATCELPRRCSDCELTEGNAWGHVFDSEIITHATCTQAGETRYTCQYCNTTHSETVAPSGHKEQIVNGIPATCTEDGVTTSSVCSECGTVLKEATSVPARGHEYSSSVTAPACTQQGYTTYSCSCGYSYQDQFTDATGHDYSAVVIAPSCTETGYTVYTCSVCGDSYTSDETPANGHVHGEWVVVTPAAVGVQGLEQQHCTVCGEKVDERTVPALPEEPVEPEYVLGDANGDGKVTAADARIVLRTSAKLETLEGNLFLAADVNKDSKITAADARKILRVSAKIETF